MQDCHWVFAYLSISRFVIRMKLGLKLHVIKNNAPARTLEMES